MAREHKTMAQWLRKGKVLELATVSLVNEYNGLVENAYSMNMMTYSKAMKKLYETAEDLSVEFEDFYYDDAIFNDEYVNWSDEEYNYIMEDLGQCQKDARAIEEATEEACRLLKALDELGPY